MASPIQQYDDILAAASNHKFVFLVYFRGHWCPFCMSYLHGLQEISSSVAARSGAVVAVTAEASEHLAATRKSSGYTGQVIVDERNSLAAELKQRGMLDVAISKKGGYEHGMAQPAVLVLKKGETVPTYRWEIVPSMMNLGGAKDRPVLEQIWQNIEADLDGKTQRYRNIQHAGFASMIQHKLFTQK